MFSDNIQDMDFTTALQSLISLFIEQINTVATEVSETVKYQLQQWIASHATFIQALLGNLG